MASRLELQTKLEELLGSKNVYYQPPESIKMSYPAIKYSLKDFRLEHADNKPYYKSRCYEITVISKNPDPEYINKLLEFKRCKFDRHYKSDNLNHYTFTLYY